MIVYKITNVINGKVYVGQTIRPLSVRYYEHVKDFQRNTRNNTMMKGSRKLYSAFAKHGVGNFRVEEIDRATSMDELNLKEQFWIEQLDSMENGYNLTSGGLNRTVSKETKEIIRKNSQSSVHAYKITGEFVASFVSHEEASRQTGALVSGISSCCSTKKGSKRTAAGLQWSLVKLALMPPFIRKIPRPPIIRKATAKIDQNGEILEIYSSRIEAARKNNCAPEDISRVCVGKRASINGLRFVTIT